MSKGCAREATTHRISPGFHAHHQEIVLPLVAALLSEEAHDRKEIHALIRDSSSSPFQSPRHLIEDDLVCLFSIMLGRAYMYSRRMNHIIHRVLCKNVVLGFVVVDE